LAVAVAVILTGTGKAAGDAGRTADPAPGDTLRLSLQECVDRAIAVGEEMKQAAADRQTAHARYLQARSDALPQLSLNTTYTRQLESIFQRQGDTGIKPFEPDRSAPDTARIRALEDALPTSGFYALSALLSNSSFASENTWVAALSLRQKIFQGGSVWSSVAAAKHALRATRMLEEDKRDDVVLSVRQAYLNALLADRGVRISELGLEQSENHLQRVQLRRDAGTSSEFELLQAEVARDNQVPQVLQGRSLREVAYLELRRLCNLPKDAPLALKSPLLGDVAIPSDPAAVDTTGLIEAAMHASGITALDEMMQARGHAITVAAADKWPDFSAFANLSQQAFPSQVVPKRGDWLRDKSVGLSVSWKLFDGFLTKGAIEEARSNRARAAVDLANARELVRTAVIQGRWELDRSAADLRARTRTVELAKRALDLANLRYDEGASTMLEVTDARIAWQIAQSNEALARRDYFAALARLERYTGEPVFRSVAGENER
jgi:outer membrane protein TolC